MALAISVSAVRRVCRLRRFAWGRPGAKGRVSEQVRHTTFVTVPPRYGFAVVKPGRYSSRPCVIFACVKNAAKPSGQPGYGRPGRWRRQCQSSQICSATYVAAQNPRCQPQTARYAPLQRRCVVLLFVCQYLFAWTVIPCINVCARSLSWAVPAQAP